MKILVACEESQAVTIELRRLGHEAYSCDIEPCSGGHPEWHLQVDALELLKMKWDMILAFPPCTHLAVSGASLGMAKQRKRAFGCKGCRRSYRQKLLKDGSRGYGKCRRAKTEQKTGQRHSRE